MKRNLLTVLMVLIAISSSFAQAKMENKDWGLAVRQTWLDYKTPINDNKFDKYGTDFEHMGHGVELVFSKAIKKYLDISIPLRLGANSFPLDSTASRATPTTMFYGADALLKFHWPRKKNFISPYIVLGAGGMMNNIERKADLQFPAGIGLDFRIGQGVYFTAETQYRTALTDYRSNIQHALGFTFVFSDVKPEKPVELPPADSDGDGIADKDDKCPNTAGLAALSGCPDADGDGIADGDDACPNEKGTMALNGCPDSDGDGIANADDQCPNEKGPKSNNGCPVKDRDGDGYNDDIDDCPDIAGTVNGCPDADGDGTIDPKDKCPNVKGSLELDGCPDTDGDGIADKNDKCPNKKGPRSNSGCPEMKKADSKRLADITKNIQFNTAKTSLKAKSKAILDEIAALMIKYPDYSLSISGHTDSVGSAESNQRLSEGRAKTCYDYLVRKGISSSRMNYAGYGETQPIADNMYKAGREQNRRVEFVMFIKK